MHFNSTNVDWLFSHSWKTALQGAITWFDSLIFGSISVFYNFALKLNWIIIAPYTISCTRLL